MNLDGSDLKQLTKGSGDDAPSLSPDGRWVIFHSPVGAWLMLWKVSIEGGEPAQMTPQPAGRGVVSPDGRLIAYYYLNEQTKRPGVAVIPFEGGEPLKVFREMPLPAWGLMRWSPDGKAITYIVTREGVSNLWSQPLDGGKPQQLTDFKEDQIFRFAWSRHGKDLALDRGATINDIILISHFR